MKACIPQRTFRRLFGKVSLFLLSLVLLFSLFSLSAFAADTLLDTTREITLRVGNSTELLNPASSRGMAFHAYYWKVYNGEGIITESHVSNSPTSTVKALKPGRVIVSGYLSGSTAKLNQISSNYDDDTHTWDKFYYTSYSDAKNYVYRFHITVLNADGSQPAGPSFEELTAQMEAEEAARAERIKNVGSGTCGDSITWDFYYGTLIIGGKGKMPDYDKYERQPWFGYDIKTVIIREGITHVGAYAFSSGAKGNRFTTIEKVMLASSVQDIGEYAFMGAESLKEIVFSEGLHTIGDFAFGYCDIDRLILPQSIRELGGHAFAYCNELTYLYLPDGIEKIGSAFDSCDSLKTMTVPESCTDFGGVFSCDSMEEVIILGHITYLDSLSFCETPNLKTVYLPDTLTEIDKTAFELIDPPAIKIYFEGNDSQWKKATYDKLRGKSKDPLNSTVFLNCTLPKAPAPPKVSNAVDIEAEAKEVLAKMKEDEPEATKPAENTTPHAAQTAVGNAVMAYEMPQLIRIDGRNVILMAYALKDEKGNATNYAKLRDVAALLAATPAHFGMGWSQTKGIFLLKGEEYNGAAEDKNPFSGDRQGIHGTQNISVSDKPVLFETLTLKDDKGGAYNYVKLRDLGAALGIKVGWDGMIVINTGNN